MAGVGRKEPDPFAAGHAKIAQASKPHQFVAQVDRLDQSRAEQIALLPGRRSWLHGMVRIGRVSIARIRNLAIHAQQIIAFSL